MTTKTLKDQKLMIIIFGATGDLAKTKLLPALYWLYHDGVIHKCAPIVCVARKDMKTKDYVDIIDIEKNVPKADKKKLDEFKKMIIYQKVSFDKPDHQGLKKNISRIERKFNCTNNKVFYLATPPELFKRSVNIIRRAKLLPGKGWKRIVFEKPFGNDERTAKIRPVCHALYSACAPNFFATAL